MVEIATNLWKERHSKIDHVKIIASKYFYTKDEGIRTECYNSLSVGIFRKKKYSDYIGEISYSFMPEELELYGSYAAFKEFAEEIEKECIKVTVYE